MSISFAPPAVDSSGAIPSAVITQMPEFSPPYTDSSPPSSSASSTSIIIVIIIIASAVIISASIYLLLRLLSKRFHRTFRTFSAADDVVLRQNSNSQQQCHVAANGLLDSLPLFTFRSVTGSLSGGDCAVCLSKFEPHDQLRLLPVCCHAFHAACIDTWILSNQTCPLCRSTVLPSDSEALDKILSTQNRGSFRNGNGNSGSFRIEIGSISRRRGAAPEPVEGPARSYSIGSFEYIVDDNGYEVSVGSIAHHQRGNSDCTDKEPSIGIPIPEPPGEAVASEVSGGRSWLRELSSRAMSFRSSGRFCSGSSRWSEPATAAADDVEANRVGEEISELFRWLSGF